MNAKLPWTVYYEDGSTIVVAAHTATEARCQAHMLRVNLCAEHAEVPLALVERAEEYR